MSLQAIRTCLEGIPAIVVSERGEGKAKFLYLQKAQRAVEIAETQLGIWIECWDDTDKENETKISEETVATVEEVVSKVKLWFGV
jgi:hypothetical protein